MMADRLGEIVMSYRVALELMIWLFVEQSHPTYSALSQKVGGKQVLECSGLHRRVDKTRWAKPRSRTSATAMGIAKIHAFQGGTLLSLGEGG